MKCALTHLPPRSTPFKVRNSPERRRQSQQGGWGRGKGRHGPRSSAKGLETIKGPPRGRPRPNHRSGTARQARVNPPIPASQATTPWGQQDTRTKEVAQRSPFQGLPAHAIETRRGPHKAYHASLTTASNLIMVHIGPPPKCRGKKPQPDARECPAKLWWGPVSVFQASDPHR